MSEKVLKKSKIFAKNKIKKASYQQKFEWVYFYFFGS